MATDKRKPSAEYVVGYGKPPAHSRFKKGESGNPKGRPKGTLNLETVLMHTLRETVVINENGQRNAVTKLEAAFKQLVNKSVSGDLGALRQLLTVLVMVEQRSQEAAVPLDTLDHADQKVVMGVLKRLESDLKGGGK